MRQFGFRTSLKENIMAITIATKEEAIYDVVELHFTIAEDGDHEQLAIFPEYKATIASLNDLPTIQDATPTEDAYLANHDQLLITIYRYHD
jgi:hypothetical protein